MKKKIIIALSFLIISGLIFSLVAAGLLLAPNQKKIEMPTIGIPIYNFSLQSESGSDLAGWHVKSNKNKGVIVLLHGIRASRLDMLKRAKMLHEEGYSSVLIDFQAHGESSGENITIGFLEKFDALAAIKYAKEKHPNEPVGLIGVSLGGAAVLLASPLDVDVVILESVFPDLATAVHNRIRMRLGSFSWLPAEILLAQIKPRLGFDVSEVSPIDKIGELKSPVFIISGKKDLHTTEKETRELFSKANEPKKLWLVEDAAHVDLFNHALEEYRKKIVKFLNENMVDQF